MLCSHKVFGATHEPETRYSPATCIGCDMKESPCSAGRGQQGGAGVLARRTQACLQGKLCSLRLTPPLPRRSVAHFCSTLPTGIITFWFESPLLAIQNR